MTKEEFIAKVKNFEGFRSQAYRDSGGTLTIGYGKTDNVKVGDTISKEVAEQELIKRLATLETYVRSYFNGYLHLTNDEIYAFTDFVFNCGIGNLSLLTANKTRTKEEIYERIVLYNKCSGKSLRGLTKRRKWEQSLFNVEIPLTPTMRAQSFINDFLSKNGSTTTLKVDGIFGEKTFSALQECFNLL